MDRYSVLSFHGFHVTIDTGADISDSPLTPGRVIFNFDASDGHAVVARVDEVGTRWLAGLLDRDGSLFATVMDPDGNYVQIIQLSEARASMASA